MPRRRSALLVTAVAIATAACESRSYIYRPAISSGAVIEGKPAAHHRIPPGAPRGDVRVATFGFADLSPVDGQGEDVRALHVRMIVSNDSDTTWTVDTREQRVALPGSGESRAAYARSDDATPPGVEIPPGVQRSFDLFFPLPSSMQRASELPSFDTIWTVHTGAETITQRTPFERLEVTPVYETRPYPSGGWYGWGPPYYYDPYYARGGAFFGVGFGPVIVERPIVIRPAPPPPSSAPPPRRVR